MPFNTWYVSNAATAPASVAAAAPAVELRYAARASLLGARMVMFCASDRALTSSELAESRASYVR